MFKENEFHTIIENDNNREKEKIWTTLSEKNAEAIVESIPLENNKKFNLYRIFCCSSALTAVCSLVFLIITAIVKQSLTGNSEKPAWSNSDFSFLSILIIVLFTILVISVISFCVLFILKTKMNKTKNK